MWKLKKKLTDLRTDLNHRIDRLEVDKNALLNRTQRHIRPDHALNGCEWRVKHEQSLMRNAMLDDLPAQMRTLHEMLDEKAEAYTTGLHTSMHVLSKELQLVGKSLESLVFILDKVHSSCDVLERDMNELEKAYEEKESRERVDSVDEKLTSLLLSEEDDEMKSGKLKLAPQLEEEDND